MKSNFRIALLMLLTLGLKASQAQVDPHFSQYYAYPAWLNPALTGAFDGNYRVSGIYRNQWASVASPFVTPGASVEVTTNNNINFGVSVLNQTVKSGGYNYLTAYGSAAYTGARFGANGYQRLVFALQGGIINRRFDQSKLTTGDENWNPSIGYVAGPSEQLALTKSMVFDIGAGVLFYDGDPAKKANFYAGFSASHLNQPENKFAAGTVGKDKVPMRFTGHAGLRLLLNDMWSLTPNLLYLRQGNASERMAGAYATVKAGPVTDVMFGANYRFEDAISPYVGFSHNNMVLGVSYDVNTSDLGKMVKGTSSFEISLSFIGRKPLKTPEDHFICPRL